jgi:hypothetical protein
MLKASLHTLVFATLADAIPRELQNALQQPT